MLKSDRRKLQKLPAPRRRSHDVVIWEEGDGTLTGSQWCVYDSAADKVYRLEDEQDAFKKFREIKAINKNAEML